MTKPGGGQQVEQNFAQNLRARREAAGLTQEQLAERMKQQGFPFVQATVWKIESGHRQVTLAEGLALADALTEEGGYPPPVQWFAQAPRSDRARQALQAANRRLFEANAGIQKAVAEYLRAIEFRAVCYRDAADVTPPEERTGVMWEEDAPDAPELVALRARLDDEAQIEANNAHDQHVDAIDSLQKALRRKGWTWEPLSSDDVRAHNAEH